MNERVEEKGSKVNPSNNGKVIEKTSLAKEKDDFPEDIDGTPTESESETDAVGENDAVKPKKKKRLPLYIGAGILLVAAIGGLIYWLYARQYESTDDAFIEGDIVQVSPKVSAYVAKVYVKENQPVHKGDLLVELDTKDYEARLEQARAQLKAAEAQRTQSQASVNLTRKTTEASQNQARSNVQTTQTNVEQTRLAANAKQSQI